jgi:hypothetical protein
MTQADLLGNLGSSYSARGQILFSFENVGEFDFDKSKIP